MEQMWTVIVLVINLALFSVPSSEGCSCMPQHPQTAFCNADFVVRAKVMSSKTLFSKWIASTDPRQQPPMVGDEMLETGERRSPSEIRFAVSIGRTFKAKDAYININNKTLFTSASSASCGVHLEDDTAYLIMGRVVAGKAWVSLCDTVMKWDDVPKRMRKLLVGTYARNCDCKVRVCFNKACAERLENSTCAWSFIEDKSKCYTTHGACVIRKHSDNALDCCKWDKSSLSACGSAGSGSSSRSKPAQKVTSSVFPVPTTTATVASVSINSTSTAASHVETGDSFAERR